MEKEKENEKLKFLAFKKIQTQTTVKEKNLLEEVIDDNFSLNDDEDRPYDDIDFIFAKEISGNIRDNNPTKMLTANILQTFKKCKDDFYFEEVMKPRRELTEPSEGL
jgi:hypothetical protein